MTLVLALQAQVFGDGGLLVLGANVTDMALIGVAAGAVMKRRLRRRPDLSRWRHGLFYVLTGWLSVMVSALAVAVELGASGKHCLRNRSRRDVRRACLDRPWGGPDYRRSLFSADASFRAGYYRSQGGSRPSFRRLRYGSTVESGGQSLARRSGTGCRQVQRFASRRK